MGFWEFKASMVYIIKFQARQGHIVRKPKKPKKKLWHWHTHVILVFECKGMRTRKKFKANLGYLKKKVRLEI